MGDSFLVLSLRIFEPRKLPSVVVVYWFQIEGRGFSQIMNSTAMLMVSRRVLVRQVVVCCSVKVAESTTTLLLMCSL